MVRYTLLERRLRICTGVILATYLSLHLLNHGLGLISLSAMESMRLVVTPFWRSPLGGILLYGSFITHFLLALWSLFRRSSLRMPAWEFSQIVLGLCVIPLAAGHVAGTWGSRNLLGLDIDYEYIISGIQSNSWWTTRQFLLVLIVWFHVSVGLHFWLRLKSWYRPALPVTYVIAVLIPLMALVGATRASFEIESTKTADTYSSNNSYQSSSSKYNYGNTGSDRYGDSNSQSTGSRYGSYGAYSEPSTQSPSWTTDDFKHAVLGSFYGLLGLTFLVRWIRLRLSRRKGAVRIHHPGGMDIYARDGQTLLEALRAENVPHASVCGGRARCTTCRVRIGEGLENCSPVREVEKHALMRIMAEPNVRLACQTRATKEVHITPLLEPDVGIDAVKKRGAVQGSEQKVVTLFLDLRDSTQMGEKHLPYDVLFILNRFFSEMTEALDETEGHYSQFTGDGLMALYGLEGDLSQGCRNALEGAKRMQSRLAAMNQHFGAELSQPLRIGIGINCGDAIVGTMGPPTSPSYSAIGDSVNAAARLESQSKELDCVIVVAREVAELAGADTRSWPLHSISVRGKTESLEVYAVS